MHLSHLKELFLRGKFVVWSGAFVVVLVLGADFVLLMLIAERVGGRIVRGRSS